MTNIISFIVTKAGPLEDFMDFSQVLTQRGYKTRVYTFGLIPENFKDKYKDIEVQPFYQSDDVKSFEEIAQSLISICENNRLVVTDVGDPYCTRLQQILSDKYPLIPRVAYYDRFQPYLSKYSQAAVKTLLISQAILVGNYNLTDGSIRKRKKKYEWIEYGDRQFYGIGYHPEEGLKELSEEEHSGVHKNWEDNLEKAVNDIFKWHSKNILKIKEPKEPDLQPVIMISAKPPSELSRAMEPFHTNGIEGTNDDLRGMPFLKKNRWSICVVLSCAIMAVTISYLALLFFKVKKRRF